MTRAHPEKRRRTESKEIIFQGEGYASAIKKGKYSTLRLDSAHYSSLLPGDEVEAVCKVDQDDENPVRIPLVILDVERGPLAEQDRVILATNGFLSWQQAASRLSEIYGREIDGNDETANILYLPKDVSDALPHKQQMVCLIHSATRLVRDRRTREIFLPSIFYTHAYQDFCLNSWLGFCELNGIITTAEMNRLYRLVEHDQYIGLVKAIRMFSDPQAMWDVLDAKGYAIYDRLVLLKLVKNDGEIRSRRTR